MMAGKLLFFAVPPLSLAFRSSWLRKDAAKFSMNLGLPAAAEIGYISMSQTV